MMKIVVAIDSLKGSLTSIQAGEAIEKGIKKVDLEAEVVIKPLADGGEGTVDALVDGMGGNMEFIKVMGPARKSVLAKYGIIRPTKSDMEETSTAIMEMSQAAGITQVTDKERNPLYTTTYGVGQMIVDAIHKGCRRFIMGIGGSATNDGGVGMLQALGYDFLDKDGNQIKHGAIGLKDLVQIKDDKAIPELKDCEFHIACDVTNPLCGEQGCSVIFGPQKGATEQMIKDMDHWLADYAKIAKESIDVADGSHRKRIDGTVADFHEQQERLRAQGRINAETLIGTPLAPTKHPSPRLALMVKAAQAMPERSAYIERYTSVTDAQQCSGCQACIGACPTGARSFNEATGLPDVDASLCTACGCCIGTCPIGACDFRSITAKAYCG